MIKSTLEVLVLAKRQFVIMAMTHSLEQGDGAAVPRLVAQQEIEAAGTMLGICFEKELWSASLVKVLSNPAARRRFLRETSINDVRSYALHDSALIVDAWDTGSLPPLQPELAGLPAGGILFDANGTFTLEEHDLHWQESLQCGYQVLTEPEAKLVKQRMAQLDAVENGSWCAQRYPDGYAYVCMVGVNPRYRGHGVLSALFKPVIELAKQASLPLCLECYAPRLTEIYAHQGFELIETEKWDSLDLTQYRMVRQPGML